MTTSAPSLAPPRWASPAAAALLIALFYGLMLASVARKSVTVDETLHATAGYAYWRFNDYRLDPGNGTLAQRLMALPLLTERFRFPPVPSADWNAANGVALGNTWFNLLGNDMGAMLRRGRAVSALIAAMLAALVWRCAREILGPEGAMLALLLCVLNPTLLANGPLMTTDTPCALLLLAATLSGWSLLQRLTPGRVLLSGLLMGALFVTKMSAAVIVPIALVLVAARWAEGGPLTAKWGRQRRVLGRGGMALGFLGAAIVHAGMIVLIIWAAFGFRYSAFGVPSAPGPARLSNPWEYVADQHPLSLIMDDLQLTPSQRDQTLSRLAAQGIPADQWTWGAVDFLPAWKKEVLTPSQAGRLDAILSAPPATLELRVIAFIDRHRLLPQAYTFGWAYIRKVTRERPAFFNGQYSVSGWKGFFPYTVLVKTPLSFFGILALALAAIVARWRRIRLRDGTSVGRSALRSLYAGLPLAALFGVYWLVAISSHLNIGHRHVLPTYPPLFVLGGAAAIWIKRDSEELWDRAVRGWSRAAPAFVLAGLVALFAAATLFHFPNYLAYFNVLAGGPDRAYRHLVDSSLDWGQDLPGVQRYIAGHPGEGPFYLSYFGSGSPAYYGIEARLLNPSPHPLQLLAVPAERVDSAIADIPRRYPDFEVVARGQQAAGQEELVILERPEALRLQPGTYLISATMLEWGPWDPRYEKNYQRLDQEARPFLTGDGNARLSALRGSAPGAWMRELSEFTRFRSARLTAFLRTREADGTVNGSILIYHVSAADLTRALDGPPPESVRDPQLH